MNMVEVTNILSQLGFKTIIGTTKEDMIICVHELEYITGKNNHYLDSYQLQYSNNNSRSDVLNRTSNILFKLGQKFKIKDINIINNIDIDR